MARLIDIQPLIDECVECMNIEWNKSVYTTWAEAEEDFKDRLLDAPVVDAVEVIRCHECQHSEPCKVKNKVWCPKMGRYMKADGFCSEGVMKDA